MLDNKQNNERQNYLDVDQVADKFAVSRRTVERIVERLQIPRRKFRRDRKLYYSLESVARIGSELDNISRNVERDSND